MQHPGRAPRRRRIRVALGARSYPIELGFDTLDELGAALVKQLAAPAVTRAVLITTPPVARHYAARVARSLKQAGVFVKRITVPDGERSKSLGEAGRLYDRLLAAGADRDTVVVALGGGVVGDLAGFVASTFLRGLRVVQVPTTLLAMADSSIGGKTGVNLKRGKNLVGAFHQPRLVWMDVATLRTLPARHYRAGLAEVVKHAAIRDAKLFRRLERNCAALLARDPGVLLPVLERSCRIKAEIISDDERESGLRRHLNFGHTLGHAVETLAAYRGVLHGEAVAIGMAFAARRSEQLGLCPAADRERLEALLLQMGLPTALPRHPRRSYLRALKADKKMQRARLHFVALCGIGRAVTVPLSPAKLLPPGENDRERERR